MRYNLPDIRNHPNRLAGFYRQFDVENRLLFTGHSHQAWPDVAYEGVKKSWEDASLYADEKWEKALEKAAMVRQGFANLLDDEQGYIALGSNTHELVVRFLSSLDLKKRPKIITTSGEFHSIRRQLARLSEEGIEVVRADSYPVEDVAEKIIAQIDSRTAAVLVSSVFFETGFINPGIRAIASACADSGVELLVDAYHSLNVAPFSVKELGLQRAFVTGGGYKYCQLGEGNCFLRFPAAYQGRPLITGWFSEFSLLSQKESGRVQYGEKDGLFAGSTYDPVSHYRAAEVFRFFEEQELHPAFLREISQHQTALMVSNFLDLDLPTQIIKLDPAIKNTQRAGFVALNTKMARQINEQLMAHGVLTDFRGQSLRFGPAPYHPDKQVTEAIQILGQVIRKELL